MNITKDDRQLLCTFSTEKTYSSDLTHIRNFYTLLPASRCFIFCNEKDNKEIYITYNVKRGAQPSKFPNTISIHRKKQTNTLYSLNALNQIVKDENGGDLDNHFQIHWEYYQNSLIITGEVSIRIIPLKIIDVILC